MTSLVGVLSNCGDFLPGTEPRVSNPVSNSVAAGYVIQPPTQNPVFLIPVTPISPPTNTPIPGIGPSGELTPTHYIEEERTSTRDIRPSTPPIRPSIILKELETKAVETKSTNSVAPTYVPNLLLNDVVQALPDTLYSPYYNFYDAKPAPNTALIENQNYLNIFSPLVAYEVLYALQRQGNNLPWTEFDIINLTTEKVAISLNRNLFVAFNNLHNGYNTKLDSEVLYNVVKKHLVAGTIAEFDSEVYTNTYQRQLGDVLYTPPTQQLPTSVATGVFQEESINPNYEQETNNVEVSDAFKRMRFLPEDIGAYVSVQQIDGNLYELPITNEGIPTQQINV